MKLDGVIGQLEETVLHLELTAGLNYLIISVPQALANALLYHLRPTEGMLSIRPSFRTEPTTRGNAFPQ
jgi:hypothetical protein